MRALFAVAVFLSGGLSMSTAFAGDWSTIRIGTEGVYPPWNATGDDGKLEGFEVDLAHDLCRRMKASCKIIPQSWDGMIPALTTGKYDAVMAGMPITDERERVISFTACYASEAAIFAVKPENALVATSTKAEKIDLNVLAPEAKTALSSLRQALAGTIIGAQIATTHADFLKRYFDDVIEIRLYDTADNLALDLDAGRIDGALSTRGFWSRLGEGENGVELALIGPDMIGGVFGKGVGVGLRKEDDDLRALFDQAIAAAIADGTVARLSERWFGADLSC